MTNAINRDTPHKILSERFERDSKYTVRTRIEWNAVPHGALDGRKWAVVCRPDGQPVMLEKRIHRRQFPDHSTTERRVSGGAWEPDSGAWYEFGLRGFYIPSLIKSGHIVCTPGGLEYVSNVEQTEQTA